jgi:putative transposase
VNGRKRHILVDSLGLLLAVVVHSAGLQDREGARLLLAKVAARWTRLQWIWADGGYTGALVQWTWERFGWFLSIVKRPAQSRGWVLLPRRWIVERTFGWLGRYRRLSKDYEFHTDTSETMVLVSMTQLMVRRLARQRNS